MDENGKHGLCLLIIGNPSSPSRGISHIGMSRSAFYNSPPSCHSKQGLDLARPLRVVLDASKNGSVGLNNGVNVEGHCFSII
jgi:hypothetical protein